MKKNLPGEDNNQWRIFLSHYHLAMIHTAVSEPKKRSKL